MTGMNRFFLVIALGSVAAVPAVATVSASTAPNLVACCRAENDLFRVLLANGIAVSRANTPADAVFRAKAGDGVLILADGDSPLPLSLPAKFFERAAEKQLRIYIEYPESLPDLEVGKAARPVAYERLVVNSDFFGGSLRPMRNSRHKRHVVRAGEGRKAASGCQSCRRRRSSRLWLDGRSVPNFVEHPKFKALVATAGLSHFVTARYAPADAWRSVWAGVLRWLAPGREFPELKWAPTVRPSFAQNEALSADVERTALAWDSPGTSTRNSSHPNRRGDRKVARQTARAAARESRRQRIAGHLRRAPCRHSQRRQPVAGYVAPRRLQWRIGGCLKRLAQSTRRFASCHVAGNILDYWYNRSGAREHEWGDPEHGEFTA